ncbi:MAG: hypothetical protein COX57_08465 [Alphaproteobacteria bacterium CG_4_10_14_0_2_um_filter_63_37]|nr:MAG: hypothetical protein AUJ55_07470 [Proteobacteria bacterium CG1_02_64_396]PJA24482.1 MAG: hypothetical protein COX57_08465 [Alphaproteobacteria bacterium CG_4_10_14_0_2_um_filter_63_37]
MKRMIAVVGTALVLAGAAPLHAAEPIRVALSGQAETVVANDEAVVTVEVTREGKEQEGVRREVDAVAGRIVEVLKKSPDITVQTVGRATYPIRRGEVAIGWSVRQTFQVIDRQVDDLSWTGRVEKMGGMVQGVDFRVSDQALREAKRGLIDQAADDLRVQAAKMATLFGSGRYRIESLALDGSDLPAPMPMRMMATDALEGGGAPPMAGGRSTVHLTLSGVVLIEPAP